MQSQQRQSLDIQGKKNCDLTRNKREKMVLDGDTETQVTVQAGKKWKQCCEEPELQISEMEGTCRDWSQFYK